MIHFFFLFFLLNLLIFTNYSKIAKIYKIYDLPDKIRKYHTQKIPLLGGLMIYLNILLLVILINFNFIENFIFHSNYELNIFFFSLTFIFIIGFLDDKYNISSNKKLTIISLFIYFLLQLDDTLIISNLVFSFYNKILFLNIFSIPMTILCFLLFMNAYNMLDGINCQAGFYAIFIFFIFIYNDVSIIFFYSLIIVLLFFLFLNYKNKMFLGNSGSLLLSYIIGFFFIKSFNKSNVFFSDEIFLIMMIPGIELLRVAILRLLNKKHPFEADRNHIHHIIIKQKSLLATFFLIQILLLYPFSLFFLSKNFWIAFISSLVIYSLIIYSYSSMKNYTKN